MTPHCGGQLDVSYEAGADGGNAWVEQDCEGGCLR